MRTGRKALVPLTGCRASKVPAIRRRDTEGGRERERERQRAADGIGIKPAPPRLCVKEEGDRVKHCGQCFGGFLADSVSSCCGSHVTESTH